MKDLPAYISEQLHVQVNVSLSRLTHSLSAIEQVYKEANNALQYAFLLGYGNVFAHEIIKEMEQTPLPFELGECGKLEAMLSSGEHTNAVAWLNERAAELYQANCSYKAVKEFLAHSFRIVTKITAKICMEPEEKERLSLSFEQAVYFQEALQCVLELVQTHQEYYRSLHTDSNVQQIMEIKEYVRLHCREDLSISTIASAFQISTGHLSRMFKSVMGENLSIFIVNTKLEQAAVMICENESKNIVDIAKDFGYYTPTYFTRLFKEKFGLTPSQYRKANVAPKNSGS
jgi:YesN/AraC family two-component response regulator